MGEGRLPAGNRRGPILRALVPPIEDAAGRRSGAALCRIDQGPFIEDVFFVIDAMGSTSNQVVTI